MRLKEGISDSNISHSHRFADGKNSLKIINRNRNRPYKVDLLIFEFCVLLVP